MRRLEPRAVDAVGAGWSRLKAVTNATVASLSDLIRFHSCPFVSTGWCIVAVTVQPSAVNSIAVEKALKSRRVREPRCEMRRERSHQQPVLGSSDILSRITFTRATGFRK
jgi:hypothetical protein